MANEKPTRSAEVAQTEQSLGSQGHRLGGARADFIASLGRKIGDLRDVLPSLVVNPANHHARDDLRRKLHALGTSARMLRFEGMTRCIVDLEAVLERATQEGVVRSADLERVSRSLDDLPALAWGEERPADVPRSMHPPAEESARTLPPATLSVLVVGDEALADALLDDPEDPSAIECERVGDVASARSATLAVAPDVVLVDGELQGAADFVERLLDDPLTESTSILVVVTPGRGDGATRFTALGVAKVLPRPILPGAVRAACQEIVDHRDGKTVKMTLGEPTVAELGERLAAEVRRAIVLSVDAHAQGTKVALGDGTEVWGALWGAIARVREVVTRATDGAVRYSGDGPEGALALAPVMTRAGGAALSERAADVGRSREDAMDVSLTGRRVVVADDDPGVTWFISDLLRTAGCVVHEALDGRTALRLAYEVSPELVVSDILMPGLDGFALCRALRRDVALRDTPVILLSWKEDLLQRVRELGASAAAYLRKESDARAILARVREVLRPRARIAARLRGEGEVRGRLDGLTVRTLFELVLANRPEARVSLRDASFLYEVELAGGGIRRASRTSGDGGFLRGDRVVPAMLGVGAGRFVVSSTKATPGDAAPIPLAAQFAKPIAKARAALAATTGPNLLTVAKVVLDDDDITGYLLATPEPARALVQRLARGESPHDILMQGEASAVLVEDVLVDLATRGAVVAVYRQDGSDALGDEAKDPKAILQHAAGAGRPVSSWRAPAAPLDAGPMAPASSGEERHEDKAVSSLGAAVRSAVSKDEDGPLPLNPESERRESGRSAPLVDPKDLSIPVVVEPTLDLRPRNEQPLAASQISVRVRPAKRTSAASSGSSGSKAALSLAALLVAAVATRAYVGSHGESARDVAEPPAVASPSPGLDYAPLPPDVTVPAGQGLLRITAAEGAPVRVDGRDTPQPLAGGRRRNSLSPPVFTSSPWVPATRASHGSSKFAPAG